MERNTEYPLVLDPLDTGERIIIRGGKPLRGKIRVNGAKNSVVALLAAAALSEGSILLDNLPMISDARCMLDILEAIGFHTREIVSGCYRLTAQREPLSVTPDELAIRMRASYYFLGALLGRTGSASVALPGGCKIGARPIDQHLKGFRALGAEVELDEERGRVTLKAKQLVGTSIYFDIISVGATVNVMLAACRAKGVTILENVAREPEIVDVANFLNAMGAQIRGAGTETIRITGVDHLGGCDYTCLPDRIEAGTFMMAAAATGGDLLLENVIPEHLEAVIAKLREMNIGIQHDLDSIHVDATGIRPQGVMITTLPYPGYPTDLQPQAMSVLSLAEGESRVMETMFEQRFGAVQGLNAMGANITVEGTMARITGVPALHGAEVMATDLRCGATLLIAGLAAQGETHLGCIYHIDRGYNRLVERLTDLGMDMRRISREEAAGL